MEQETWEHAYINVNKVKLHYVRQGSGPLVVLLHGFPEFWYSWRHQIPVLAQKYTVVAVDMRGYNLSAKPKGVKHYRYSVVAGDIRELIVKLGFRKAHIVGHDWGGGIGWVFAKEFPGYIDKLAVLNCPPPPILTWNMMTNFEQLKKSWYIIMFQLPWLPEFLLRRNLRKTLTKGFRGWAHNKDAFSKEDIDLYVKAFTGPYALTGPLNYYRAAFRMAFEERYRVMKTQYVPTLVIWGLEDRALGTELSREIEKYCQGYYAIKYIEDSSHWVQNDSPELVNKYLMEYLEMEL